MHRWASCVHCVYATNGAPADGADARNAGFTSSDAYASARAAEADAAMAIAGVSRDRIHRLNFVDQSLMLRLHDLAAGLETILHELRPEVVLTHAYEGGHPDHDALSLVVSTLASNQTDAAQFSRLEFAGYAQGPNETLVTNAFTDAGASTARRIRVSRLDRERKRAMLACFRTQRHVLRAFDCSQESLRQAPRYDYLAPPNGGLVWYDRLGWSITSRDWCRFAATYLNTHRFAYGAHAQC